ncbi:CheR family methyltransferase [Methylosinus sp. PW1]|uniref:CheR family methyltransferase n=1 Tax=Methylosinus sp. PW1 TaxID=107636 RepID=UPI00068EB218|nr:chemotaxis protein CheB [Methylosinus sp. PW1]
MKADKSFPIVGVGASAGGIQALESLFRAMPANPGMSFVIIMHLAPDRKSLLTDILARHAKMSVEVARDGQGLEKDKIYVIPPAAVLTIASGRLRLIATDPAHHERSPIDVFFSALARDRGESAIGVVLSGSGSDGVLGIKAIKEHGGVTMAQASDGSGPGFGGMPGSAIASGLVDFAIPVDAMAEKLVEIIRDLEEPDDLASDRPMNDDDSVVLEARQAIYSILRDAAGHDFSGYKTKTFMRRVRRRMHIQQCEKITDYVERLREAPEEATALFRDLLINVTSFFRDADAFNALRESAIPRLFEGKGAADTVRVWVPGCSTGEEVYSIAIILREHIDGLRVAPRVTIFATDIDEAALTIARAARYPPALMDAVSDQRRRRFFTAESGSYVVAKAVRDLCVFSPHSILRDPPFSHMDLVSCRNLLIYLGADVQREVLPIFHYSLRAGGILFLGMSESIGQFSDLFTPLDKKHCLFEARDPGRRVRMPHFMAGLHALSFPAPASGKTSAGSASQLRRAVEARIAEGFAPPHVVVNEDGDIIHFSTRTGKYLEAAPGAPDRQIFAMARKGLRLDLRSVLREAIETRRSATRQNVKVEIDNGHTELVSLTAEPLQDREGGKALFLILFQPREPSTADETPLSPGEREPAGDAARLERELFETRERLQATIEEYETALEELKSANEELISMNEETQSTNEELESSKEELQSLNEEMRTVNHELESKIDELDRANSDLRNVFASTRIATIFMDRNLVIRSFTPAASQIFNIIPSDAGRPLTDLATKLDYPELTADLLEVLESGTSIERRVHKNDVDAPYYLARLTPYRGASQQIDGVVATFIDVTSTTRSEEKVQKLQADRLNSMKEMGTGLAHEINQPLSAAATYLHAAQRSLKMPSERRPASIESILGSAVEQVMWAAQVVDHLREFVSRDEPKKTFSNVNKLIEEAYELTLPTAKQSGVRGTFHLNAKDDRALVDEVQIKQVLINLMRNAIDAMSASGKRELTISTSLVEGDMIRIDVADTGPGVPEKVKAKLFEPFVTTKTRGIGVGLSISRNIVEAHYGKIWAEANPDGGAIFSFTLPLANTAAGSVDEARGPSPA